MSSTRTKLKRAATASRLAAGGIPIHLRPTMPSTPMSAVKMLSHSAPAPTMPGSANRNRACALAVLLLCLFPTASGTAGEPTSVLPQGVFATDDGCTMLSQAGGADDIDATDFFVLSNGELTGMDLACHFTDAEPSKDGKGKSWEVKASCELWSASSAGSVHHRGLWRRAVPRHHEVRGRCRRPWRVCSLPGRCRVNP